MSLRSLLPKPVRRLIRGAVGWLNRALPPGAKATTGAWVHAMGALLPTYQAPTTWVDDGRPEGVEVRCSLIPEAGEGLFATKSFSARDRICPYVGTLLTPFQWLRTRDFTYFLGFDPTIDARPHPNVMARYVNHHFDSAKWNCQYWTEDGKEWWIVATRDIRPGEELYANYGAWYSWPRSVRQANKA